MVSRRLNYIDLTTFVDIASKALLRNSPDARRRHVLHRRRRWQLPAHNTNTGNNGFGFLQLHGRLRVHAAWAGAAVALAAVSTAVAVAAAPSAAA